MKRKDKVSLINQKNDQMKLFMNNMLDEIETLEHQLKHARIDNFKKGTIKNLKIFTRTYKLAVPYIITAGVLAGGCKLLFNSYPFYPNDQVQQCARLMNKQDSRGNKSYIKQYESFENSENILMSYTDWKLQKDNFYTRTIKSYELGIGKKSQEEILKIIDYSKNNDSVEKLYGEPINIKTEYKDKIDLNNEDNEPFFEVITFDKDKKDYIYENESTMRNVILTVYYLIPTIFGFVVVYRKQNKKSLKKFSDDISKIKNNYPKVDIAELNKILKLKKDNYDRLLR